MTVPTQSDSGERRFWSVTRHMEPPGWQWTARIGDRGESGFALSEASARTAAMDAYRRLAARP